MGRLQVKRGTLEDLLTYEGLNGELLWAEDAGLLYITDAKGEKRLIGAGGGTMVYKGEIDCHLNPLYPAADQGHVYQVSASGKIGGESGLNVDNGDVLICVSDGTPEGTQGDVGKDWDILQYNIDILPTSKGGTGKAITPAIGDLLVADSVSSFAALSKGNNGDVLTIVNNAVTWSGHGSHITDFLGLSDTPDRYAGEREKLVRVNTSETALEFYQLPQYDNYSNWLLKVDVASDYQVASGTLVQFISGSGIYLRLDAITGGKSITVTIATIAANSILANATATLNNPAAFAINASSVPGRLAAGNIVNIPFGTAANQIAWGDHTHAQLHNQSHALVGSDHTLSGGTSGKLIRCTGATTYNWSTFTMAGTCAQGDILYASASNVWSTLVKSTTSGHFLSNSGTNNNPQWRSIAISDLPANVARYYAASYESGGSGVTTLTITAATHGCGLIPIVQFFETNGVTDYRSAAAEIIISQSNGDVTVNTSIAVKGKVIIIGA